jgi:hypothetical protein
MDVQAWNHTVRSDNEQFMSGQISREEYWGRVHERDAQVKAMSPEDRKQVNGSL